MSVAREKVYEALTRENTYAQGWGGVEHDKKWSLMDWLVFAEKYTGEAKIGYANYTDDVNAIHQRLLKAASLIVTALQYSATEEDLLAIAGVSSKVFPIHFGGLQDFVVAQQAGTVPPDRLDRF
jgi:hypothetical protein